MSREWTLPRTAATKSLFEEWYCDSKGHVKMAGGYGCSIMIDQTQNIEWECDQSNSSDCQSYPIESKFLTNGALGQTAEFIIEDDTGEDRRKLPKSTAKQIVMTSGSIFRR